MGNSSQEQGAYRQHAIGVAIGTMAGSNQYGSGWGGLTGAVDYQYNFNRYMGVEARISGFSMILTNGYQASLNAVGIYPLSNTVDVFGKVGFSYLEKSETMLFSNETRDFGIPGLGFGVGLGYHFNPAMEMTFEYNGGFYKTNKLRGDDVTEDEGMSIFG